MALLSRKGKFLVVALDELKTLSSGGRGTILMGLATPTEAAACGALGSIVLAAAYRNLTLEVLWNSAIKTVNISAKTGEGLDTLLETLQLVSEAVVDVFRFSALTGKKQMAKSEHAKLNEELQKLGLTMDENAKDELKKIEMAKEGEITTSDIPDVNDISDVARGEKGKSAVEGKGTNPGEGEGGEGKGAGKGPGRGARPRRGG
mgnify:CR=1 FL=1